MRTMQQCLFGEVADGRKAEILDFLRERPNEPVALQEIVKSTGYSIYRIDRELKELEGPLAGCEEHENSYLHLARCSKQAVYIT